MSILIDLFKNKGIPQSSNQNRQTQQTERKQHTSSGNNSNSCHCCLSCKNRINRLEMMLNELFSYMGEFLPDQLDGISKIPTNKEMYRPYKSKQMGDGDTISIKTNNTIKKGTNDPSNQNNQADKSNYGMQMPSHKKLSADEKSEKRSKHKVPWQEKKRIVNEIQEKINITKQVGPSCKQVGVSDSSFYRWKREIESGGPIDNDDSQEIYFDLSDL